MAGLFCERIGNEAFGGQVGASEVAAGELRAGGMQLPGDADRGQLIVRIEHVDAQMLNRFANRHAAARVQCVFAGGVVDHAADHGFGRAIFVDDPRVWGQGLPACECCCGQGFAADHHHCRAERSWMIGQLLSERFQMGRGEFDQAQRGGIAQALAQGVERIVLW